ncbi:hypothetical protein M8C21_027593 [Ambrosia artemisiifolia]|uniref:Nucleotide-diphospho-sugar transferase domain-containing protein n=1 Tax=Ambrosia artemisiifolia TaxID=4212 RepID=A0AAD5BPP3_AMBAR|nr:hypothetical protein M8C21_027593 [Ambrosia artemisiifolia]
MLYGCDPNFNHTNQKKQWFDQCEWAVTPTQRQLSHVYCSSTHGGYGASNLHFSVKGTPFFHSMVARAQASNSDISVLMDSETILLPDFISTLNYVRKLDHDWLLIASSRNISDFTFQLDGYGQHWIGDNGQRIKTEKEFLSHGWWEDCDDTKIFLCMAGLHHLQVSNFVVCALDDEIYSFCVLQGLPVFRDRLAPSNISYDDCHFGTNCFQRVTKVKSRVVLEILKLGYNVLMSDVDVYWFKNPLPLLTTFGPAVFVAQSDEYKITGPINLPRRLNSGFYYAQSDNTTIAALRKVVKHASLSNLSEQPSFYDTLCGFNGSYRLDDDTCQEPETNLTVHFLDRNLFPNGAYLDLWDSSNVSSRCMSIGCFVLHNNWISGRQKKLERQVSSGLWEYDTSTRMCLQSWQRFKPVSYF